MGAFAHAKYDVDNNDGYGEALIVNGEKYYLMSYYDIKKGDLLEYQIQFFWFLTFLHFSLNNPNHIFSG